MKTSLWVLLMTLKRVEAEGPSTRRQFAGSPRSLGERKAACVCEATGCSGGIICSHLIILLLVRWTIASNPHKSSRHHHGRALTFLLEFMIFLICILIRYWACPFNAHFFMKMPESVRRWKRGTNLWLFVWESGCVLWMRNVAESWKITLENEKSPETCR